MARRLRAQLLSITPFDNVGQVVGWLGAVQAQDYLGALWAVGLRLGGGRASDVERALEARLIIRSWPMRGTLHFLAAKDARWMIDLLAGRAAAAAVGRLRALGLDEGVIQRARRALVKRLEGGRRVTRPSAYRVFEQAGIATGGQRGLHLLWRLAQDALLCFGPRKGKQQTIVLFDEWLPDAKRLPRGEALAELARRYFTGHGPATERDLAWWSGLSLTEARQAIALAGRTIASENISGQLHWFGTVPTWAGAARRKGALVLPPFDELLVGYADRSAVVSPAASNRLSAFQILGPVVVHGGRLVATWRRQVSGRRVRFSVSYATSPAERRIAAVSRALDSYAQFFDLEREDLDSAGRRRAV